MLSLHAAGQTSDPRARDSDAAWIDMFQPTRDEELAMEARLGVLLPTREDMAEIETSSRLYLENGAAFMTAQVAFFGGQEHLQSGPVTFVLAAQKLVTIRYIDPASFAIFAGHIDKQPVLCLDGPTAFLNLLDVIIDRTADLIERTQGGIDELSRSIFTRNRKGRLEDVLILLGNAQNDIVKIRDSLVGFARLTAFAAGLDPALTRGTHTQTKEFHDRLHTLSQDVASLSDHATYVSGNIAFLLDAALGLINVEQNSVMKLISVTSVVFLPLTLIASIYGMNFDHMPFLHDPDAFWASMAIMAVIAVALVWWFRMKRWV
ncbi:MAG TPA: magnesium transporter CorA family protein [Asticcacaulis sp.]|jgi:magnesium transporter